MESVNTVHSGVLSVIPHLREIVFLESKLPHLEEISIYVRYVLLRARDS